jgi:CMP-N-acetylneuraminic acid synthetase
MRPKKLADDKTSTTQVILHCLKKLSEMDENVKYVCCIYAAAPFIKSEYIIEGFNTLCRYNATTCFPVTTYSFPILRSLKIAQNNRLEMIWPEFRDKCSQDLPNAYHDAGQFYWIDVVKFKKERTLYSNDAVPVILPRHLVQDIDDQEDWKNAEYMFRAQQLDENG